MKINYHRDCRKALLELSHPSKHSRKRNGQYWSSQNHDETVGDSQPPSPLPPLRPLTTFRVCLARQSNGRYGGGRELWLNLLLRSGVRAFVWPAFAFALFRTGQRFWFFVYPSKPRAAEMKINQVQFPPASFVTEVGKPMMVGGGGFWGGRSREKG